uniref:Uncharacterized protein n=1 Tax=Hyaloperonospora arabidopsidis (strain Emoy2) TaxID=559515 RepID=M4BSX7_HYAAE
MTGLARRTEGALGARLAEPRRPDSQVTGPELADSARSAAAMMTGIRVHADLMTEFEKSVETCRGSCKCLLTHVAAAASALHMSRQLQVPTYVGSRLDRPEKSVDDGCGSCKGVITSESASTSSRNQWRHVAAAASAYLHMSRQLQVPTYTCRGSCKCLLTSDLV